MSPNDAEHQSSRLCCRTRVLFEIMIWWKKTDKGKTPKTGLSLLSLPPHYHPVRDCTRLERGFSGRYHEHASANRVVSEPLTEFWLQPKIGWKIEKNKGENGLKSAWKWCHFDHRRMAVFGCQTNAPFFATRFAWRASVANNSFSFFLATRARLIKFFISL